MKSRTLAEELADLAVPSTTGALPDAAMLRQALIESSGTCLTTQRNACLFACKGMTDETAPTTVQCAPPSAPTCHPGTLAVLFIENDMPCANKRLRTHRARSGHRCARRGAGAAGHGR